MYNDASILSRNGKSSGQEISGALMEQLMAPGFIARIRAY
jgi:hypothetical protein